MNKVLVCLTVFNENVKLKYTLERYLNSSIRQKTDCLVLDDGSDDETTEIIQSFAGQGITTIRHEQRQGVGASIRTAIKYAQKKEYEVLVVMSGNTKDDSEEIYRLIDPIINENYDFAQGSRYINSAGTSRVRPTNPNVPIKQGEMPLYRKAATKVHPFLMSLITKKKVSDSTNGFRAFRLSIFSNDQIDIDQPWLDHYEMEPYLLYKALTLNYKYIEAPVTKIYPARKLGYTKMRPVTGWWSILRPLIFLGLGIKK